MQSSELDAIVQPFIDASILTEVLYVVKSGKEASVYACSAHPDIDAEVIALKVYKHLRNRSFRNDAVYQEGRLYGQSRERRAYERGTEFGLDVHFLLWVTQEWEHLNQLYNAGVYVPVPVKQIGPAIAMEFFGTADGAYPTLQDSSVSRDMAARLWQMLLSNIETMLAANYVHADLSSYNILLDVDSEDDPLRIIDVPQAVDARMNPNARAMLLHDVETCYRWFARHGVTANPQAWVANLWRRWELAEL